MKRCFLLSRTVVPFLTIALLLLQPNGLLPHAKAQTPTQPSRQLVQTNQVEQWPAKAKRWALVIGVDKYRDGNISPLRGAANDAGTLAHALTKYAGFPSDQVILLATDQPEERQPTRINILTYLSNLGSVVPKDGLLLVSFAGHGIERGGHAYLIPSDARLTDDVSLLEESAISVQRMHDRIRAANVAQVIVLLDACRNDPSGRADAPNTLTPAYTRAFNFDVRNREVQAFATLYATSVGQRAYEYQEKRQGYFTWAVVEGLKGAAANKRGEVTLAALVRYVQEVVPKRIAIDLGASKKQFPFYVIEGYRAEDLIVAVSVPSIATGNGTPSVVTRTDPMAIEQEYWDSIKNSTNAEDFRDYLKEYPTGPHAIIARGNLRRLETPEKTSNAGPSSVAEMTGIANNPGSNIPHSTVSSNAESKAALYDKFVSNRTKNPEVAYRAGKQYLAQYEPIDGSNDQFVSYINKWVAAYEQIFRRNVFAEQLKAKNYNEAFATGRAILADNPEDLLVVYELARAGFVANDAGNRANNADTVAHAKKALSLLQAGETFEKDKPVTNKDELVSLLNYGLGVILQESQPADAANYLISAAQFEGYAKKDPRTYFILAYIYEKSKYARLANQFNANCSTEEQARTTECVELKGKIDTVIDHIIDALARAIAYSNISLNPAQYAQARATWTESLTNYYKYRNNGTDAGMKEFIANITAKPLPKPD